MGCQKKMVKISAIMSMIQRKTHHLPALPDTQQSAWQLAVIQLSGWTSLPILATSVLVLQENSFYGALLTIIVGNAILWFIRLAIILMSYKKRESTLDISRNYLGNVGSYFIAALCIVSTLAWFIAQTSAASSTLTHLISIDESPGIDKFTQMSVLLGVISTLFCMEGIVLLRRLSMVAFPLLLIVFFIAFFSLPLQLPAMDNVSLSLSGLTLVLGTSLGITSDFPTFFRHSKSLQTSISALTFVQLISLALALCSLYFGSIITGTFEVDHGAVLGSGNELLRISLVVLVFISVICANVANVYSASVGWEVIAPSALVGRKEYLILGLGLTTIFILVSNMFSVHFLLESADSSLVNLCLVLALGYLISQLTRRIPTPFEQKTYFTAWLASTIINTLQYSGVITDKYSTLLVGLSVILLIMFFSLALMTITKRAKEWINI
jgi:cytosine permease